MISVEEIMTTELHTLRPTNSLRDARELMTREHIRHIPIVDEDFRLVGLVTHRDVLSAAESALTVASSGDRSVKESAVLISDFMNTDVVVIDEHTSLRSAGEHLKRHKHGCLPVVRHGRIKGIITDSDFVMVAVNLLEQMEASEPLDDEDYE